ncbi:MAG: adenosylcobinamide-GDP ribazoletransferase [Acidobacteria bacterium]|nr:adenosylcobinamide-GDP ribazoletransferase [Acidobacteriota bacterium]
MTALLAAIGLLTRVPISRAFNESEVARATAFYPLVGAAIGSAQVAVLWIAAVALPAETASGGASSVPAGVLAVCLVALAVWLTGALHLDGLADTADGFGGGRSREEVLTIMRDPRVGAYGTLAIVLLLLLKVACLDALLERRDATVPLLVAPIVARWSMAVLGWWLPYARADGGLGAVAGGPVAGRGLVIATASAALLLAAISGWEALVFGAIAGSVTLVAGRACRRRIGGFTGDTLGATGELTEAAVWLTAVAIAA